MMLMRASLEIHRGSPGEVYFVGKLLLFPSNGQVLVFDWEVLPYPFPRRHRLHVTSYSEILCTDSHCERRRKKTELTYTHDFLC